MNWDEVKNFFEVNPFIGDLFGLLLVLIIATIAYFLTKKIIIKTLSKIVSKTKTKYDDIILNPKLFSRVAFIVPLIIISYSARYLDALRTILERSSGAIIALLFLLILNSLLTSVTEIYNSIEKFKDRPIKGYVQIVRIILNIFGGIVIIGLLADQPPFALLSAVGALTAVILLLFKDTILSFVASIQISSYDLVKVGDWIEVPQYGADGDVLDIALHTIKVQNFDKTITVIPTYKLVESSFKNWRGMQLSGGRRIKRSIFIDQSSIRFCDEEMLKKLKRFNLLSQYISDKEIELEKANADSDEEIVNRKRLTNIGTFRAYLKQYLWSRNDINKNMSFLVRQLPPASNGLGIEIYVFTTTTVWSEYEDIQANIFDHLLAIIPEFDLRIFQSPSGNDFSSALIKTNIIE